MIVFNKRVPFGSCAVLRTNAFNCMLSTAPGLFGLFKGSTLVMSVGPDGTTKRLPLAKAYLKRGMSRAERDAVHDYILHVLDKLGNDDIDLPYAIEGAFSVAKARRFIVDYILDQRARMEASG